MVQNLAKQLTGVEWPEHRIVVMRPVWHAALLNRESCRSSTGLVLSAEINVVCGSERKINVGW